MEGKFSSGGLQEMNDDGADMLTAMAKELVTEARIGESADMVWRQVQEQNRQIRSAVPGTNVAEAECSLIRTSLEQATAVPTVSRVAEIVDSQQSSMLAEQLPLF